MIPEFDSGEIRQAKKYRKWWKLNRPAEIDDENEGRIQAVIAARKNKIPQKDEPKA